MRQYTNYENDELSKFVADFSEFLSIFSDIEKMVNNEQFEEEDETVDEQTMYEQKCEECGEEFIRELLTDMIKAGLTNEKITVIDVLSGLDDILHCFRVIEKERTTFDDYEVKKEKYAFSDFAEVEFERGNYKEDVCTENKVYAYDNEGFQVLEIVESKGKTSKRVQITLE